MASRRSSALSDSDSASTSTSTPMPTPIPTPKPRRASSTERVLRAVDEPALSRLAAAIVKHGKYVVLGAAGVWYTRLGDACQRVLEETGWVRKVLIAAISLHGLTVIIFLYLVLFLPWFRGYIPHYPKWQRSARLRVLVPVLTATILLGWTAYVVSLSQAGKASMLASLGDAVLGVGEADAGKMSGARGMGVFTAMAATTALYVLTLGVLGLIPAPSNVPVRKKDD